MSDELNTFPILVAARFVVYSANTGQLLRLLNCSLEHLALQLQEDERALQLSDGADFDLGAYFVNENEELEKIPDRPSPEHVYDWNSRVWREPFSSSNPRLQIVKQIKAIETGLARPMRELVVAWLNDQEPPPVAVDRVLKADAEIQALRDQQPKA